MKKRKWIIVFALFFGLSALVLYHGWNLLGANNKIKNYLLFALRPIIGENFSIESLDLSLGAVHLKGVAFSSNNKYISIKADAVRLGFNLLSLIKNGFRPQQIPQDIIFIKPHLVFHALADSEKTSIATDTLSIENEKQKYLQKLGDFNFVKRITVSKGKISYIDSSSNEIILSNDINGWLSARDLANTSTRLVGKIFNSKNYNLNITGQLNLITGHLDSLNIVLQNYEWKEGHSYFLPDFFEVGRGVINGNITLTEKSTEKTGFNIKGKLSIADGAFQILKKNLYLDNINLEAEIADWNCEVSKSSLLFNGSPLEISGKIFNILQPKLDLAVHSPAFDGEKFVKTISPDATFEVSGLSSIYFTVTNTLENPSLKGGLTSEQLNFNKMQFLHVDSKISYADSLLAINSLAATIADMNVMATMNFDFAKKIPGIYFNIESHSNLFESLLPLPFQTLKKSKSSVQIEGKGKINDLTGKAEFQMTTFVEPDTTFKFSGEFAYFQNKLNLKISSFSHPFATEAQFDYSSDDVIKNINLTGLHHLLYDFAEVKKVKDIFDFKESKINVTSAKNRMEIAGDFLWNQNNGDQTRDMKLKLISKSDKEADHISGEAVIHLGSNPFYCDFEISKFSKIVEINKFEIKDIFKSNGRILLHDQNDLDLKIIFPNTPLARLALLIFRDNKAISQGVLSGSLDIKGALKKPQLNCELSMSGLEVNNVGSYDATTKFSLNDKSFSLNELTIKKDKAVICNLFGYQSFSNNELNFSFETKELDINSTLIAIFNQANLLSGTGNGQLKLLGTSKAPQVIGDFSIRQGKLSRFYFDKFSLKLDKQDSEKYKVTDDPNISETNSGIGLKEILIVREGIFKMQGQGILPVSNANKLAIDFAGDGNILAILPELTPFFKHTESNGRWSFQLRGSPANIVVAGGQLEISKGYLQLGDVVPTIREISLKANMEQDGFLDVEYITGKVKRRDFIFRNQRSLPDSLGEKLQPFLIPSLGLNLGVFSFATSDNGISMHIPGFMAKNEFGNFGFYGRNEKEKFYLAGPFYKPYVRGKVVLQNVNFTFPFLTAKNQTSNSDPVVDVLRSIEWDASALAGKDVHYQRQIPSGLDNVYLDIILDNGVGGLTFSGILDENSFGVIGSLESSRGNVEYLNLDFQVIKTGVVFDMEKDPGSEVDFDKSTLLPIIYGEARTTVTDSTGFPYYIYLTLLTTDPYTGFTQKRGRLGEVTFQLTSESTTLGDTEGEILASLGYSPENLRNMATDLIGISADNLVFRPLFRPFERKIEQTLGLDVVRFSSRFTRNLIEMNVSQERNFMIDSKLFLLRSTKLMVGKYLANQLFLMYSGQLEAGMDYRYQHEGFGLSHKIGLEYRINPSLLLQMEYDYNSLMLLRREDKRVLLIHSFPF